MGTPEEPTCEEEDFANDPSKTFLSAMKRLYLFWSFLKGALYSLPFTDLEMQPPPREDGRGGQGHAVRTAQPGLPGRSAAPSEPAVPEAVRRDQPVTGALPQLCFIQTEM